MISVFKKKRLAFITIVYWFLLLYIIAALVWWFIALEKQNDMMFDFRIMQINKDSPAYDLQYQNILHEKQRKTAQYIGEGSTFLLLILIGASFVYRATRKQLRLSDQQQNFMMAVTHELKTPIAVVNLNLETLQLRKLDEEKQKHIITSTLIETKRLNALTNNILVTSQLESGNYTIDKNEIDLSFLLNDVVADFKKRFPNRIINTNIEDNVAIKGEKVLFQLLMSNLIDNALKYSAKETSIQTELYKKENEIFLKVIDEGIGIINEEKKKIFDKFYRSGSENTRKTKGTGLGLYLCKKIAESNKAKIKVTDNKPCGSIFTVVFKV